MRELILKAPAEIRHFVLIDRDMRPGQLSLPVLQAAGDVVGCTYPVADMRRWADPAAIHLGLVRVRREVFEKIPSPWFRFEHTADGSRLQKCECLYFRDKAIEAGFSVVRAGWCDHKANK